MPSQKSKVRSFEEAIGRFVLAWASLEIGLDLFVLELRNMQKPEQRTGRLPHQLCAKIAFTRNYANKFETVRPYLDEINELLDEIDRLSPSRHDFVHGAMLEHQIGKISVTALMGTILQPNGPRRKPVVVTTAQVRSVGTEVRELDTRMLNLVQTVAQAFVDGNPLH